MNTVSKEMIKKAWRIGRQRAELFDKGEFSSFNSNYLYKVYGALKMEGKAYGIDSLIREAYNRSFETS